jgi:membrane-associated protease RseP (regulator of RpoE activity)
MENGWSAPPSAPPRRPRWGLRRFRHAEHPLFHLALLVLTLATTTFSGALFVSATSFGGALVQGLRFSIPAMLILGVHEMGHYLMCRRYGLAATYPYFLPAPPLVTPFGTFGAVIRIKEPIRTKTVLLDVGAAGPLAGFVTSFAFLLYSVGRVTPVKAPPEPGTLLFEYPLLVRFAQDLMGTGRYTSVSVHEDPTFMAAWFGLLITALNLLPIGQLDGGHVLRAALGRRQPFVSYAVVALALVGALRGAYAWAFFTVIVVAFVGVLHPPVEDDEEPLGTGRLTIALVCLCVFLLCFALVPIKIT